MADEKLIFPIGFDLEEGVKQAEKEWKSSYQKQLQKAVDAAPLKAKIELDAKGLDLTAIREYTRLTKEQVKSIQKSSQIRRAESLARERERVEEERVGAAKARRLAAEERLTQVKQRSTQATHAQNAAYKTQSGYLQRLFQRMVAYASVTQAFSFIRNIRDVTAQFELQRVALGSIIGDLNEANAMFEQIKAAAVKSPFQIKELVTYTKQLAAYKIETDELFETTQKLADVSAGLGVGMERLVLAYGQIRATGYLRASEVRQLTEAGIPIVEELAKKMTELRGETVSAAEVMGMISERAISFGMVKEVFDDMTSAGGMFYKMQEKQAETLAGQWSNLQDAISIMYEEIGNTESVNNAMKGMIGLIKSLAENWRTIGTVTSWSLGFALGYAKILKPLGAMIEKQRQLNMAFDAYQKARLAYGNYQRTGIESFRQEAEAQVRLARAYRQSAKALSGFGGALKAISSFVKANWIGILLTAVVSLASWLASARQEANRLNKELEKIGTEGALQADQSVRNFERLARTIRESANGSVEQSEAMAEMRRSYGEFLPSQDQEILNLVREKEGYDAVIQAIRKKIALQTQEQQINTVTSEFGQQLGGVKDDIRKRLEKSGLSRTEISLLFAEIEEGVKDGTINLSTVAKKIPEIFKNITGESVSYIETLNKFGVNFWGSSYLMEYIDILTKYENKLKDIISDTQALNKPSQNLSDTFNTWQKELSEITEGKNLKGEGIRVFDDESISQINKLTDATARVAEEYDKLAKEKKEVDKALLSEGARADKDTYAKLQERLGKINEGMSGLYDFLKKYGALDLIKSDDKGQKYAYQALKDELAAVEKIYKRYQDLRKLKSETDTQSILAKEFKGVSLNTLSKAYSPEQMLAVYEKALAEAQRLGKKDLVLEIQTKIGEFNVAEEERKLEKRLKDLSDSISRTKTAKEFFDRMLGLTGDKQLSASLTMSVYGEGGEDLGTKLAQQTADAFKAKYKGINFSKTAISDKGVFDWERILLEGEADSVKLGEELYEQFLKDVEAGKKSNADWLTDLQKTYQKAFTFEERRTQVMQQEAEKRKEIEESALLDDLAKRRYTEASKKREAERISAINLEEFKASDDYLKIFEDIEHLSIPIIDRLIGKIRDFIATNKELSATDLKNLTEQIQKLEEGKISKSALFAGFGAGVKEWFKATNAMAKATKGTKEYEDAVIAANKAHKKVVDSLGVLQGEFSQAQQFVDSFAGSLGIAEDDEFKVFLDDMSNALGGVAQALAFAQLAVQLFDGTIKSFLASNPIGWILLVVSAVIGAFQAIANAKVRNIEKEIERVQSSIENLEYAYEKLQKAQEKAFGSDYISNYRQQLANLEATQDAYLKQAELERSKGKKADVDKIGEYEEAARDTADSIADMYGQLSEHFLGADLASAARDFAVAWIDAYKEFANTTDAMKAKFQDMIQNMVVESLLAKVMERALKPVFDMIDDMGEGDFYNPSFWQNVMSTMQTATENGVVGAENVMSMLEQMGINLRGLGGDLTGISRDIATASEESILGLAAGINTQNFYISQVPPKLDIIISLLRGEGAMPQGSTITLQDLVTLQNQHLSYLPNIAQNTADTVARCERAAVACENMAEQLGRVIKPNGTPSNYKLHTTINS
jgi:hypothetical protein